MNNPTTNWKSIFGLAVLALIVIVAAIGMQPPATSPGLSAGGTRSGSRPVVPPSQTILTAGKVLAISSADRTITTGTYRIERDQPVLASQKTTTFNAETIFRREINSSDGKSKNMPIASSDVRVGDLVEILLDAVNPSIATRVLVVDIPLPPTQ